MYESWHEPTKTEWALYILMALFGALTQYFAALAYKYAQAGTIAPLEYSNLLWVALGAWLIWGDLPGPFIWAGGALIILGGMVSIRAEDPSPTADYD
jgi:drug/metabolite transporter (DMT)-like permease